MFSQISKAGTGTLILVISGIFELVGFDVPQESVAEAVNGVVALIGLFLLIIGQLDRDDLLGGLFRKEPKE